MEINVIYPRGIKGKIRINNFTIGILSLLIFITETPLLARNVPNLVYYGLVLAFFASTFNIFVRLDVNRWKTLALLFLYFLILLIYKLLHISSADFSYYSTIVKFFFFLIAMLLVVENMTRRQKYFIIMVILVSMMLTVFDNVRLFMQYGATTFVHLFQWERFTTNSVNTTFVSSQLFFVGIMFTVFLHTDKKKVKLIAIILIAINLFFIAYIAQRMIILCLSILLLPLIYATKNRLTTKKAILLVAFMFVLTFVIINYATILDIIDRLINSPRLHLRFEQIKSFVQGGQGGQGDSDGSMQARISLFSQSIKTWFSSLPRFVFGSGDHRITYDIIGNHSNYIDDCARYGIVGMFIWIPLTFSYVDKIRLCAGINRNTPLSWQMKAIMLIYIVNAIVSSVYEATVGVQLFILLPIVFSLIQEKKSICYYFVC